VHLFDFWIAQRIFEGPRRLGCLRDRSGRWMGRNFLASEWVDGDDDDTVSGLFLH
jgi:hypothetical protein